LLSYALVKLGPSRSFRNWAARAKNIFAGRLRGPFPAAAVRGGGAERLPAFAPRVAGYGGIFRQVYIFKAAVNSHLLWLAVLMAVNSVIGAYYYLRVIVVMYMRESARRRNLPLLWWDSRSQ